MTPTPSTNLAVDRTDGPIPQELQLPPDMALKAAQLAATTVVDPRRPETVTAIGASAQQKSAAISDELIGHVKNKNAGEAGKLLGQMSLKCRGIDVSKLSKSKAGVLSHVPFLSKVFDVAVAYESTLGDLDGIATKLTTAKETLISDIHSMSTLYDQNLVIYRELMLWQEVVRIKIRDFDKQITDGKAVAGADPLAAQGIADLTSTRGRLDKHLNDLELTATIRLQFAPKVRIVQAGDVMLADKLASSVLNTIPIWKDNIALAIAQSRQKEAADLQDAVDDTTNAMLRQGADMLHATSVQIAKQAQRGIADVSTLQYATDQLIATLDETAKIAEEGEKARIASRGEMEKMNSTLTTRLTKAS